MRSAHFPTAPAKSMRRLPKIRALAPPTTDPAPACARLAEFLGSKILPHPEKMPAAIEAGLHRQRG
ncbi:MAG: hypothetical protein KGR46_10465 [Verrucomicrobia bacterium]|nr:hypothetical protein [Verrucomicrobiota bacterium]